ncbi:MAG: Fic family protein, partial [Pseudomonadota bacterium]
GYANFPAMVKALDDVVEVSNYVAAMEHGLSQLDQLPLSVRLIKSIHAVLMAKGRGQTQDPGEFRRSQNWIGGTRPGNAIYVPPPPQLVVECMSDLERFIHDTESKLPVLIKAALVHVQFESIHPFEDGNGRIARAIADLALARSEQSAQRFYSMSAQIRAERNAYYT